MTFAHPPERVFAAWLAVAARQPRTRCLAVDHAAMRAKHVQRTRWLRFADVVQVQVEGARCGGAGIAIDSRSRLALYDFGVNRRRVGRWLAELGAALAQGAATRPSGAKWRAGASPN